MKYLLVFTVCIHLFSHAQDLHTVPSQEQLDKMEYEELLEVFNEFEFDSIPAEKIARTYLNRARKAGDTIKMARGYDRLARIFNSHKNIRLADSIIYLTKNMNDITYPALGYLIKGFEFYLNNDLKNSTNSYLKAYNIAESRGNLHQVVQALDMLIYYKSLWGNKEEALKLQRERHAIIIGKDYLDELKKATRLESRIKMKDLLLESELLSLQNFVLCFINLKNMDSARIYNDKGRLLAIELQGYAKSKFDTWFYEASTEIEYYSKSYRKSLQICDSLIDSESELQNNSLFNLQMFKGLSLLELGELDEGYSALKVSDSIFRSSNGPMLVQPYKRALFERLLEHYNSTNQNEKSLECLNTLLTFDSIAKINYFFFEPEINKKYDTPKLLKQKQNLIIDLRKENARIMYSSLVAGTILIIVIGVLFFYASRQRLYKKRFLKLQSERNNEPNAAEISLDIEIVKKIKLSLESFERNNLFLNPNISLQSLAKKLKTNANYLSRTINFEKGKNFPQYLHDLRIEYALNEFKVNNDFKKYTIKAIAFECGYSNAGSFSKAFYRKTGIYPSFYVKQLEKSANQ